MTISGSIRCALGVDLGRALDDDLARLGVERAPSVVPHVTEGDLASLPEAVQRYLRFMGVSPGPRQTTLEGRFHGRFRMAPGARWMRCEAVQFTRVDPIARVFRMRVTMAGVLPVIALDSYTAGTGAMHADAAGVLTVADARGPELDLGELTTWVNDAVLYAPSMLLGPATTWTSDDPDRFEVAVTDAGRTSRSVVTLDERGAPVDFASTDRFAVLDDELVQARWRTPIGRWSAGRRPLPLGGSAVWDLPDGPFTYVEGGLDPASIVIDGGQGVVRAAS